MRRTGQRGSMFGFIVTAIVLAVLLAGGVYLVRLQSLPAPQPVEKPQSHQPVSPLPPTPVDNEKVSNPAPSHSSSTPLSSASSESHELPQTGPEQTLASMIVLAIFSGALTSYVCSRRTLSSL